MTLDGEYKRKSSKKKSSNVKGANCAMRHMKSNVSIENK